MKTLRLILPILVLGFAAFLGCSDDSDCPTCSPAPSLTQWVEYDNFDNDTLNTDLWSTTIYYGGQVLEADSQLQVWGHTGGWTGAGVVRAIRPKLAWRFDLVETYFEEAAGCQGWHISAIDPTSSAAVEVLNRTTAGCGNPLGDSTGAYEIKHEDDSLAVYRDGTLLRRVHDHGISFFVIQFNSDNVYGDWHHCHVFVDDVWGLEWKP